MTSPFKALSCTPHISSTLISSHIIVLCLFLKYDRIDHVIVATINVIPHSFMRIKASMIFAHIGLTIVAIPNVSMAVRES